MSDPSTRETITVADLGAYLARPAGAGPGGPGMLLLPMITGISAQVREWADELAGGGVTTLVWDPWRGRPSGDETPFDTLRTWMSELDDERVLTEATTLLDHLLGELGCARAGVMGWCMGGRFALLLAGRDTRLAGVVAYHPTVPGTAPPNHTLDAVEHAGRATAPVMMIYPGGDDLVPRSSYQRLRDALDTRESGVSVVAVYPGAEHGFGARARHGNPVNKAAWALSWPQALAFVHAVTAG